MKEDTPTPVINESSAKIGSTAEPSTIAQRYKVLSLLGEGGMGKVYEALDTMLDRKVAVKVLAHVYDSDEQLKRFQQEAKLASKLKHPGIVTSYDFGVSGQQDAYYVMERVNGRAFDSYLEDMGPLSQELFIDLFLQITDALAHAHSLNVVHRDIKPSNIMVTSQEGKLKGFLLDFGVAKGLQDSIELSKTKTGLMVGSPRCISPEQINAKPVDCRCDIYSIGCVMFEALSGKPPFSAQTALQTMEMHLTEPAPLVESDSLDKEFLAKANEIIQRALAKEPENRYQSMDELSKALLSVLSTKELETSGSYFLQELSSTKDKEQKTTLSINLVGLIAIPLSVIVLFIVSTLLNNDEPEKAAKTKEFSPINNELNVVDNLVGKKFSNFEDTIEEFRTCSNSELQSITSLNFQYGDVSDNDLKRALKCRNLKILNLSNTKITNAGLEPLFNLPHLETLHLSRTSYVDYKKIKDWSSLAKVKSLSIDFNGIKDSDLPKLAAIKKLRKLKLCNNPGITNKGLPYLTGLKNLKDVSLSGTSITPEGLVVFRGTGMTIGVNNIKSFENIDDYQLGRSLGIRLNLNGSVLPAIFSGYSD